MAEKALYRNTDGAMIAGVCSGIADYLDFDVTLVRLITILLIFVGGIGILLYLIAWIITPQRPIANSKKVKVLSRKDNNNALFLGGAFILIGALFLVDRFWFSINWGAYWPVILIVIGIFILVKKS